MNIDPVEKKKAVNKFLNDNAHIKTDVSLGTFNGYEYMATTYSPINIAKQPMPAVIYIHGGGFIGGARDHFETSAAYMATKGYFGFCISYRLSPKFKFPELVLDCKFTVRWLRANASKFNIDPNRIAICGSSAGGNLAGMVAFADNFNQKSIGNYSEISDKVQAAILYCGIYDFLPPTTSDQSMLTMKEAYLNKQLDLFKIASPLYYVSKDSPPTLLLHGDDDSTVPVAHSYALKKKLDECGVINHIEIANGGTHKAYDFLMPNCIIAMKQAESFLNKYL